MINTEESTLAITNTTPIDLSLVFANLSNEHQLSH